MTSTNDFRQYSYKYDTERLINSFDFERGSQARKIRPEYDDEPKRNLRVKKTKGIKSRSRLLKEEKLCTKRVLKIAAAAVVLIAMVGFVINSFAVKNQLSRSIASRETEIAAAQSESISLQSKLNVLYSVSEVDKYAAEKLNMSKVRQGQVQYIDVDEYIASQKNKKKSSSKDKLTPAQAAVAAAKKSVQGEEKNDSQDSSAEESEEAEDGVQENEQ